MRSFIKCAASVTSLHHRVNKTYQTHDFPIRVHQYPPQLFGRGVAPIHMQCRDNFLGIRLRRLLRRKNSGGVELARTVLRIRKGQTSIGEICTLRRGVARPKRENDCVGLRPDVSRPPHQRGPHSEHSTPPHLPLIGHQLPSCSTSGNYDRNPIACPELPTPLFAIALEFPPPARKPEIRCESHVTRAGYCQI